MLHTFITERNTEVPAVLAIHHKHIKAKNQPKKKVKIYICKCSTLARAENKSYKNLIGK